MMKRNLFILMLTLVLGSSAAFGQFFPNGKILSVKYPDPVLELKSKEAFQNNGQQWVRYNLRVKNSSAYTDALFKSSPELAACGLNQSASRTWVSILESSTNKKLNTFCAFDSADDMQNIWFAVKQGDAPDCFYVSLNDRKLNVNYASKKVCTLGPITPVFKSDLQIEQYLFLPSNNKAVRVMVVNNGQAASNACVLRLTVRKIDGTPVSRVFNIAVPALAVGQVSWALIHADSILPVNVAIQDTTFKLNVDANSVVNESNETNNETWHNL